MTGKLEVLEVLELRQLSFTWFKQIVFVCFFFNLLQNGRIIYKTDASKNKMCKSFYLAPFLTMMKMEVTHLWNNACMPVTSFLFY